ncbi:MAG: hypothetical protein ACYDCQ_17225 [Dehalococcoidia bacterium]
MRFRLYFRRALLLRCPSCGHATLVRRPLAIHEQCRDCGLFFVHSDGFWTGTWHINYFIASLVAIIPAMVGVATGAWSALTATLFAATVATLFPLVFYWHAYSLWIAIYYYFVPDDLRMGRDRSLHDLTIADETVLSSEDRERWRAEEGALDLEGIRRST